MAKGRGFSCCSPKEWCNDCCPQLHRWWLLVWAVVLFAIALWQASHVASWRDDMFKNNEGDNDSSKSNAVSNQLLDHAEFAACVSIGAAVAFGWHCLKWNVATRQVLTVLLLGSFSVQLVTLGFASEQNERDKSRTGKDIDEAIVSSGAAGVVACGLSLISLLFVQLFSANYLSAEKQTNCCDNTCCNVSNDCCETEQCCGVEIFCSFGRFVTIALGLVFLAVVVVRGAVAADLMNVELDVNANKSTENIVGNIISSALVNVVVTVSAVLGGYVVMALAHSLWLWNETSQTVVLLAGFVALTFEIWALGYAIKFWDEGKPKGSADLDERFDTIASLTVVSTAALALTWLSSWFFSDNFASYDENQEDKKQSTNCFKCLSCCGRTIAMIVLAALLVVAFGLYLVRVADAGAVLQDFYDGKNLKANAATGLLIRFVFYNAGLGMGVSLFGLAHLYFWNRVTASALGAGFILLLGLDLLALALGSKQTDFESKNNEVEDDLKAIGALSKIQPAASLAVIFVSLVFSCDFEQADEGEARNSDDEDTTDEETGTYETETSGSY